MVSQCRAEVRHPPLLLVVCVMVLTVASGLLASSGQLRPASQVGRSLCHLACGFQNCPHWAEACADSSGGLVHVLLSDLFLCQVLACSRPGRDIPMTYMVIGHGWGTSDHCVCVLPPACWGFGGIPLGQDAHWLLEELLEQF